MFIAVYERALLLVLVDINDVLEPFNAPDVPEVLERQSSVKTNWNGATLSEAPYLHSISELFVLHNNINELFVLPS